MPPEKRPFVGGVLVTKEKHGDYYYHCPTQEALYVAALQILTERFNEGYWYPKPEEPVPVDDETEKTVLLIPDEVIRKRALAEVRITKRRNQECIKALQDYQSIEHAVKEKNGREAWACLQDSRDYEYEGLSLKRYEEVEL